MANVKLAPALRRFNVGAKAVETRAAQVPGRCDDFVGGFAAVLGYIEDHNADDRGTFLYYGM